MFIALKCTPGEDGPKMHKCCSCHQRERKQPKKQLSYVFCALCSLNLGLFWFKYMYLGNSWVHVYGLCFSKSSLFSTMQWLHFKNAFQTHINSSTDCEVNCFHRVLMLAVVQYAQKFLLQNWYTQSQSCINKVCTDC